MFQCHSPKSSRPCPLPESKRLFYTSVSLLLSRTEGYRYHLSKFHIYALVYCIGVFLSGYFTLYKLKHLPAMRETWVRSLGREDPLEKEMETHSSIPAWKIPWTEETGERQFMRSQRVRHDWATSLSLSLSKHNIRWVLTDDCTRGTTTRSKIQNTSNGLLLSTYLPCPGSHWSVSITAQEQWCQGGALHLTPARRLCVCAWGR